MNIQDEIELVSYLKNEISNRDGRLFNCYVSGSNLYGWNSPDSDIDIRGIYLLDKKHFLGLQGKKEVIEFKNFKDDYDITLFEVRKALNLAVKGNCNILEEINAPQLYKEADFITLQRLVNNAFGKKGLFNSYVGLATFNYKKFILQGKNTVKKYLYVFRGLMAGIYALQTGQIQPNMEKLNQYFKFKETKDLLQIKKKGLENEYSEKINTGKLDILIKSLFERIDKAYEKSKIPEVPDEEDIYEIDKFLVNLRLE